MTLQTLTLSSPWSCLSLKMKGPGLLRCFLDQDLLYFSRFCSHSEFNSCSCFHALCASAASWVIWQEGMKWLWEQKEGAQIDWQGHEGLEKPDRVQSWSIGSNKHHRLENMDASGGQRSRAKQKHWTPSLPGPWEPLSYSLQAQIVSLQEWYQLGFCLKHFP